MRYVVALVGSAVLLSSSAADARVAARAQVQRVIAHDGKACSVWQAEERKRRRRVPTKGARRTAFSFRLRDL